MDPTYAALGALAAALLLLGGAAGLLAMGWRARGRVAESERKLLLADVERWKAEAERWQERAHAQKRAGDDAVREAAILGEAKALGDVDGAAAADVLLRDFDPVDQPTSPASRKA